MNKSTALPINLFWDSSSQLEYKIVENKLFMNNTKDDSFQFITGSCADQNPEKLRSKVKDRIKIIPMRVVKTE